MVSMWQIKIKEQLHTSGRTSPSDPNATINMHAHRGCTWGLTSTPPNWRSFHSSSKYCTKLSDGS